MERRTVKIPEEHHFTKEQKINWVFKYLVLKLDPLVIYSHKEQYFDIRGPKRTPRIVTYLDCKCNIDNLQEEIPFPFEDVIVTVSKKRITILGDGFYYKFPPNFILTLQERFNEFTNEN